MINQEQFNYITNNPYEAMQKLGQGISLENLLKGPNKQGGLGIVEGEWDWMRGMGYNPFARRKGEQIYTYDDFRKEFDF